MRLGNERSAPDNTSDRARDTSRSTGNGERSTDTQNKTNTVLGDQQSFGCFLNALTSISEHMSVDKELKEKLAETVSILAKKDDDKKRKRSSKTDEEGAAVLLKGDFSIEDDSQTVFDWKIRQALRGPNDHPETWWKPEKMDDITTPVIGRGMYLGHLMPGRINEVSLRKLHDRSELATTKMLSSENSNLTGDKTPRTVLDRDQVSAISKLTDPRRQTHTNRPIVGKRQVLPGVRPRLPGVQDCP